MVRRAPLRFDMPSPIKNPAKAMPIDRRSAEMMSDMRSELTGMDDRVPIVFVNLADARSAKSAK
jgi:hypothetical protein